MYKSARIEQRENGAHAICIRTGVRVAYHQLHIECERRARFRGYFVVNSRW